MTRCEYCYGTDRPTHGIQAAGLKGFTERQICDPCERRYACVQPVEPIKRRVPRPRRGGFIDRSSRP